MNGEMPHRQIRVTVRLQEAVASSQTDPCRVPKRRPICFPPVKANPELSLKILTRSVFYPLHFFLKWKFVESCL